MDWRMKKIPVSYRLPAWMVEWLRGQDKAASLLIEQALVQRYGLKPPADILLENYRHEEKNRCN